MQFLEDAPGLLTKVGGSYVGRWSVSPSNYGYTQDEVASWVSSALNSPLGWGRAGVGFERVASVGPVLNIAGAKTLLSWDRLVLCELVED